MTESAQCRAFGTTYGSTIDDDGVVAGHYAGLTQPNEGHPDLPCHLTASCYAYPTGCWYSEADGKFYWTSGPQTGPYAVDHSQSACTPKATAAAEMHCTS